MGVCDHGDFDEGLRSLDLTRSNFMKLRILMRLIDWNGKKQKQKVIGENSEARRQ